MILIAALTIGSGLAAQERAGSIRGVVQDQDFGGTVAEADVLCLETKATARSDAQGRFVFESLRPGAYTLVVAKPGFTRQVRSGVVVTPGGLTDVTIPLPGEYTDLEESVVQDLELESGSEAALLQFRFDSPSLLDSIGSELISRAAASDAASALRLVSGATVKDGKSAVIRGLPDRYVSTQLNGMRLPSADEDKRAVELDQFPSTIIESIEVTKTFTPDQQGDASGGAVDVRLSGIPDVPWFVEASTQYTYDTNVGRRGDFLTYDGGGLNTWGKADGSRAPQLSRLGESWGGAVGVTRGEAPHEHKSSFGAGGSFEVADGVRLGGYGSFFYERDSEFSDDGFDDSYWVEAPGAGMTPKAFQGSVQDGDFKTGLFDVTRAQRSVQWGTLFGAGLRSERHALDLVHLYTRTAEDTATLAEDTRGKQYFFPGHDPDDPSSPGHSSPDSAPYLRLETLEYTERSTEVTQLRGRHTLPTGELLIFDEPVFDWGVAFSSASLEQPDKRQFGSLWVPGRTVGPITIPPSHRPYKPDANFTLGNLQRLWKSIDEESDQYLANLKLPFETWPGTSGYLKLGWFQDEVERRFDQDSYSNFGDNSSFEGPFDRFWSGAFSGEEHPITESSFDVDYRGEQRIAAWYAMADLPLLETLNLIGGVRFESTRIGIVNEAEAGATWFPPGALAPTQLNPGDADVDFDQDDTLPSVALVWRPTGRLTLRASYAETIARQTFKELTPILQQEYLGGEVFIGNPALRTSSLRNYDLRVDLVPADGGLLSASVFRKDLDDPIEYVQRIGTFDFTTAVNYPRGRIDGLELEARQQLGVLWEPLAGLSVGANATFLDSRVTLPDDEAAGFELPNIRAPMRSREMTNAPDRLLNLYLTYDLEATGTRLGAFYTWQGDSLLAGATQSNGNFVPNVHALGHDTLNVSVMQSLGRYCSLRFQAKNLTDPRIETVYRSPYIGDDVTRTSFTRGIEYSIGIGGEIKF